MLSMADGLDCNCSGASNPFSGFPSGMGSTTQGGSNIYQPYGGNMGGMGNRGGYGSLGGYGGSNRFIPGGGYGHMGNGMIPPFKLA